MKDIICLSKNEAPSLHFLNLKRNTHGSGLIRIDELIEKTRGMKLMTRNDMIVMMRNPHLIPQSWKDIVNKSRSGSILFLGGVTQDGHQSLDGWYEVPCMYWHRLCVDQHWESSSYSMHDYFVNTDYGSDCIAMYGSSISNHVSRFKYLVSNMPGLLTERIRKAQQKQKKVTLHDCLASIESYQRSSNHQRLR